MVNVRSSGPGHWPTFYVYLSLAAARRGNDVTAVDQQSVTWPFLDPNVMFLNGDIVELGLAPATFDFDY